MTKAVIFDFDGTVAHSLPFLVRVLNHLSKKYHYKQIKEADISALRNMASEEALRSLGISLLKLPLVVRSARLEFQKEIELLKPVEGINKALLQLKKGGFSLCMLTSNSEENIRKFLKANISTEFDFVFSGSSLFGKSRIIRNLLKAVHLRPSEAIYVGDETRDIDAARKAGIRVIAITWGINSRKVLQDKSPDFLVDSPAELVKVVEKLK